MSAAKPFGQDLLIRSILPDLDEQLDRMLTSSSRELFNTAPEQVYIVVVGGVAMMTYRPGRLTTDVDSITALHNMVVVAAQTVAVTYGLRRDWLNEQTAPLVPAPTDVSPVFQGKRLTVVQPGPEYMLATKVIAGRPKDAEDLVVLIETTGFYSVERLCALVGEVYGPSTLLGVNVQEKVEAALRLR